MTKPEPTAAVGVSKAPPLADPGFLGEIVRATLREMTHTLGVPPGRAERGPA